MSLRKGNPTCTKKVTKVASKGKEPVLPCNRTIMFTTKERGSPCHLKDREKVQEAEKTQAQQVSSRDITDAVKEITKIHVRDGEVAKKIPQRRSVAQYCTVTACTHF